MKRRGWDSNPRALADKRFSRPPRYDHFDTPARERVMGIEPTYPAWKAGVLPLNYTRIFNYSQVGVTGFEPATSWSQTRRSSQAEPHPVICLYAFLFFCLTRDIFYNFYFCLSSTFFYFFQHFFVVILFSRFVSGSLPSTCCIIPSFFSSVNTFFQKSLNNSKNSKQF